MLSCIILHKSKLEPLPCDSMEQAHFLLCVALLSMIQTEALTSQRRMFLFLVLYFLRDIEQCHMDMRLLHSACAILAAQTIPLLLAISPCFSAAACFHLYSKLLQHLHSYNMPFTPMRSSAAQRQYDDGFTYHEPENKAENRSICAWCEKAPYF